MSLSGSSASSVSSAGFFAGFFGLFLSLVEVLASAAFLPFLESFVVFLLLVSASVWSVSSSVVSLFGVEVVFLLAGLAGDFFLEHLTSSSFL